jgi:sugar phosphate isomerase/epimerase
MPGDGLIDHLSIRRCVEAAGYGGPIEVEIFSQRDWWTQDAVAVVQTILHRYGRNF